MNRTKCFFYEFRLQNLFLMLIDPYNVKNRNNHVIVMVYFKSCIEMKAFSLYSFSLLEL